MTLTKAQLEKYADVLIWGLNTARSKPFKNYDVIFVRFDLDALPLAEVVNRKLLQARMNPVLRALQNPAMDKDFFTYSDKKQRTFTGKWERIMADNIHGSIFLSAPASLTHLKEIDPGRMNEVAIARKPLRKIMERREERGLFGWTLCTFPTPELASQAGLTITEYTRQITRACFLTDNDPVKKWQEIYSNAQEIKKWLMGLKIKTMHLESKLCDLTINLGEKRKFLGVSGHNVPSFEIFTSPDWRGASGIYGANLPSYRSGNYVKDVRLEFQKGNVIKASAKQGNNFLNKMIGMDAGAKRIGEFSLTDRRFSKIDKFMADTLFDENFGGKHGNCHLAVGMSYSDTFNGNPANLTSQKKKELGFNDSALHWDLVNTEDKRVTATTNNGKKVTVYEKGMFSC